MSVSQTQDSCLPEYVEQPKLEEQRISNELKLNKGKSQVYYTMESNSSLKR